MCPKVQGAALEVEAPVGGYDARLALKRSEAAVAVRTGWHGDEFRARRRAR